MLDFDHYSAALSGDLHGAACHHLLADANQEFIALLLFRPSTGRRRMSFVLHDMILPDDGEVALHGNASFSGDMMLRVATLAAAGSSGVALAHSHPSGRGWQPMSHIDRDTEQSYANLIRELTGLPLLGLTLAGDKTWSGRVWNVGVGRDVGHHDLATVRTTDPNLRISFNQAIRPTIVRQDSQARTVHAWGDKVQQQLVRMQIAVVGLGSVGLDITGRLAAAGAGHLDLVDPDSVEVVNLDRMVGATREDVGQPKVEVAQRVAMENATHPDPQISAHRVSVCSPQGQAIVLDADVILSCVDRPWPRATMNQLAYSDLIPVIDAGIGIDVFGDGRMRQSTTRAHVVRPGRPCMACSRQLQLGLVEVDRRGLLDDPDYIRGLGQSDRPGAPNVALLTAGISAMQLWQFTAYIAAPGGQTDGGTLRHSLSDHTLDRVEHAHGCIVEDQHGRADGRIRLADAPDDHGIE